MLVPSESHQDTLLADRYGDIHPEELAQLDIPTRQKARIAQLQLKALRDTVVIELPGERVLWTEFYTKTLGETGGI